MIEDEMLEDEDGLAAKGLPLDLSDEDGESGVLDDADEDGDEIPEGMHEVGTDEGF